MQIDDRLVTLLIYLILFGLVAILWVLNYLLEKINFYRWVEAVVNKKRIRAFEDFAASRGARYSYKPKENYLDTLKDFPLFSLSKYRHYFKPVHELSGSIGVYQYTFFDLTSSNTVLLLASENLTVLPDFSLLRRYFLCELSSNFNLSGTPVKISDNALFGNNYFISTEDDEITVQALFTPELCGYFTQIDDTLNIEKIGSQMLLYSNRRIPVEELREFLNQNVKTVDLFLAQAALLPKTNGYKTWESSTLRASDSKLEIFYQCFDEEEHAAQLALLKINGIPYSTKQYVNDQSNDVFEIWVPKEQLAKADSLIEQEEAQALEDEKLQNPPCPKCCKYTVRLNFCEVKGGSIQIYHCDACKYEWPKK